jgi:DNA-binding MarR family transcriptional regulator
MEELVAMGMIYARWRRRASRGLAAFGITLDQYDLIQLARRRGAISPSIAADELGWDRPTTTLVVRKCVAAGWLDRSRSVADHRSVRLALSGYGEELLDSIEAARLFGPPELGDPLDVLDSGERVEFRRMLDKSLRRSRDVL